MCHHFTIKVATAIAGLLLAACQNNINQQQIYSEFADNHQSWQQQISKPQQEAMRWIASGFQLSRYNGIYFTPLTYYPAARPTSRVDKATLDRTLSYANQKMMRTLSELLPLLPKPIGNTLIFKGAITAIGAKKEDISNYEIIPVANVLASSMTPLTPHKQYPALFFEGTFIDANSGKVVAKIVRRGFGQSVKNNDTPINSVALKSAIDNMVGDISIFR